MTPNEILPESTNLRSNLFALLITVLALIGLFFLQSKPIFEVRNISEVLSEKEIEIMWEVQPVQEPESNSKRFIEANLTVRLILPIRRIIFLFRINRQTTDKIQSENKQDLPSLEG